MNDLEAFVDFYTRVLDFDVTARRPEYAAVRRGEVRIGAVPAWETVDQSSRRIPTGIELVLEVDDIHAERDRIVAADWPLDEDIRFRPWGLTDFRLFDPDGHYLRFTTS